MILKPRFSFFYLLAVFVILAGILFFIPSGGIRISDNISLRLPQLLDFIDTIEIKNDTAMNQIVNISKTVAIEEEEEDTITAFTDSIVVVSDSIHSDTVAVISEMFKVNTTRIQPIEFPEGNKQILHPFFHQLATGIADTSLIRILHYGDSQIERDRVTSYIRNLFQVKFGGAGPGLLPAAQPYGKLMTIFHEASENWKRYTCFGNIDHTIGNKFYGPMASMYRLEKNHQSLDSLYSGTITIKKNPYSYKSIRKFNQCQLLMGNARDTVTVSLFADGLLLKTYHVECSYFKKLHFSFPDFTEKIDLIIHSKSSVDVYGLMLDKSKGIAVDNIAMRGSSGVELSRIDAKHLKSVYASMNIKLIIFEFGGNIAPTMSKSYGFYGRMFLRELQFLKTLLPNVPIIVIGIADMSLKEGEQYVSYPNLLSIRDEMKKAAFLAGVAYWDFLEAMGGINSMPQWVKASPPLATKDYVHLTDLGARTMGKMFSSALSLEYESYIRNLKHISHK